MNHRRLAKNALLSAVRLATARHPVLLPSDASDERAIVRLRAPYKADADVLAIELLEDEPGILTATLLAYEGHFPVVEIWKSPRLPYRGPTTFLHDLERGVVRFGVSMVGTSVPRPATRRFGWRFEMTDGSRTRSRVTGHYRDLIGQPIDARYYEGDDYVDYEAEAAGEGDKLLPLIKAYAATGPALEVGCATGGMLAALAAAGLDPIGVDLSQWAIERAAARVGADRVAVCDVERDPLPSACTSKAPFATIVLWAVLEHFAKPFDVLATLTGYARPGALLFINTTNANSLTHAIFGRRWEGYFDWTHKGVEDLSSTTLPCALDRIGWDVLKLTTERVWATNADPTAASLRDWWDADARFRQLLVERDLGDFMVCVARRR